MKLVLTVLSFGHTIRLQISSETHRRNLLKIISKSWFSGANLVPQVPAQYTIVGVRKEIKREKLGNGIIIGLELLIRRLHFLFHFYRRHNIGQAKDPKNGREGVSILGSLGYILAGSTPLVNFCKGNLAAEPAIEPRA